MSQVRDLVSFQSILLLDYNWKIRSSNITILSDFFPSSKGVRVALNIDDEAQEEKLNTQGTFSRYFFRVLKKKFVCTPEYSLQCSRSSKLTGLFLFLAPRYTLLLALTVPLIVRLSRTISKKTSMQIEIDLSIMICRYYFFIEFQYKKKFFHFPK